MRNFATFTSAALLAVAVASSVFAADAMDLKKKKPVSIPEEAVRIVPPPAPKTNSISVELGPEMWANVDGFNKPKTSVSDGAVKDWAGKIGYSHTFDGVWVVGTSLSQAAFFRSSASTNPDAKGLSSTKLEATLAYKYKLTDAFTLTPGMGLGYSWGWSKINNPSKDPGTPASPASTCSSTTTPDSAGNANSCFDAEPYYQVTLAGDYKFNSEWTWNVFNIRYRNAFGGNWVTPKISTGVTYSITSEDAVYVSAGWGWKNAYNNTLQVSSDYADSSNITVGYKHAF